MANVLGIIAEYNPFHNGHLYHIEEAKKQSNADIVVAVISGNFTQRGNTALVNKWERAKMAINEGCDLVIELPTVYSTSSAENFAQGAIKILKQVGVTSISFGIEQDNIESLKNIADLLFYEPKELSQLIKEELRKGLSFPKARENAIVKYFKDEKYRRIISFSNNILAIEYLKAIKKYKLHADVIGIKRKEVSYNSKKISKGYASATAIRQLLIQNKIQEVKNVVPNTTYRILQENIKEGKYVFDLSKFEKIIIYKLRHMETKQINDIADVTEGLENLLKTSSEKTNNIFELIDMCKSKRYTQTKIQRILIYILLDITKKDIENSKKIIPYVRILGMTNIGKKIIKNINSKKIITSVKKFEDMNKNKILNRMIEIDKKATDIYTLEYENNSQAKLDYKNKIILA